AQVLRRRPSRRSLPSRECLPWVRQSWVSYFLTARRDTFSMSSALYCTAAPDGKKSTTASTLTARQPRLHRARTRRRRETSMPVSSPTSRRASRHGAWLGYRTGRAAFGRTARTIRNRRCNNADGTRDDDRDGRAGVLARHGRRRTRARHLDRLVGVRSRPVRR